MSARVTQQARLPLCALAAFALSASLLASRASADQSTATQESVNQAVAWARQLWKDAQSFIGKNAKKARGVADAAEKSRDEAKKAREAAEASIAEAKAKAEAARTAIAAAESEVSASTREAERLRGYVAYLEDGDGRLRASIDSAVKARLPALFDARVKVAVAAASAKLSAGAARAESVVVAGEAAVAVEIVAADEARLAALCEALAWQSAQASMAEAARAVSAAMDAVSRKAGRAGDAIARARSRLQAALPGQAALKSTLAEAVRRIAGVLVPTLAQARLPAARLALVAPAEDPDALAALAAAIGGRVAYGLAPGADLTATPTLDLTPVEAKLAAAAATTHEHLRARRATWLAGVDTLSNLAKELSP